MRLLLMEIMVAELVEALDKVLNGERVIVAGVISDLIVERIDLRLIRLQIGLESNEDIVGGSLLSAEIIFQRGIFDEGDVGGFLDGGRISGSGFEGVRI